MEQPERRFAAFKEDRFGNLHLKPIGSESACRKRPEDHLLKSAAMELNWRNVHRDANMVGPGHGPRTGFANDPRADRNDQAGFFGHWDEFRRRDHATLRMV